MDFIKKLNEVDKPLSSQTSLSLLNVVSSNQIRVLAKRYRGMSKKIKEFAVK